MIQFCGLNFISVLDYNGLFLEIHFNGKSIHNRLKLIEYVFRKIYLNAKKKFSLAIKVF